MLVFHKLFLQQERQVMSDARFEVGDLVILQRASYSMNTMELQLSLLKDLLERR